MHAFSVLRVLIERKGIAVRAVQVIDMLLPIDRQVELCSVLVKDRSQFMLDVERHLLPVPWGKVDKG